MAFYNEDGKYVYEPFDDQYGMCDEEDIIHQHQEKQREIDQNNADGMEQL